MNIFFTFLYFTFATNNLEVLFLLDQCNSKLWTKSQTRRTRYELIETIREYRPLDQVGVKQARILLLGHTNVGKSSFFNTINSIFRNHVTAQAVVGSPDDQRTVTTKVYVSDYNNNYMTKGFILLFDILLKLSKCLLKIKHIVESKKTFKRNVQFSEV